MLALYCYGGKGCQGVLTPFTHEEADLLLNKMGTLREQGFGKPVVFLRNNAGEYVDYVDDRRTLTEINVLFGGTGEPSVITTHPDLEGDIQPRDGDWSVASEEPSVDKCPAGTEEQVAALRFLEAGDVTFKSPFDPEQAMPAPEVKWLKIRPNAYKASLSPDGAGAAMRAVYDLTIVAETEMKGELTAVATVPGMETCRVLVPFTYTRK